MRTTAATTMTPARTTCQVCERAIKMKHGAIALHGYKRPGTGCQTGSCMGAQHLPYELSCDLLKLYAMRCVEWRDAHLASASGPVVELSVVTRRNHSTHKPTDPGFEEFAKVTEETLDAVRAQHRYLQRRPQTWAELVEHYRTAERRQAAELDAEIERVQRRIDAWKAPA